MRVELFLDRTAFDPTLTHFWSFAKEHQLVMVILLLPKLLPPCSGQVISKERKVINTKEGIGKAGCYLQKDGFYLIFLAMA